MHRQFALLTLLLPGLLVGSADAQQGSYTIIDIGDLAPAGLSDGTNATGLNELGHVAAISGDGQSGSTQPVLYRDGQLIPLGALPGQPLGGGGKGVNNLGQVVGWTLNAYPSGGWQSEPFIWTEGIGMINPIDHLATNYSGESWGINDSGQQTLNMGGASMWDPVEGFRQIHFPGQALNSGWKAWEINEDGVVSGSAFGPSGFINAFRYDSATDTIENLHNDVLDHHSDAYGLNDLGDLVGFASGYDGIRPPMIWKADGQTVRMPAGDLGPSLVYCSAEHANNHGDVVGLDEFPGPSGGDPALAPRGWVAFGAVDASPIVKQRLLTLLDTAVAEDWERLHPFEINDRGEICGIGVMGGDARGFLMVPNTPDRFRNLAHSLPGVNGRPVMIAKGTLEAGSSLDVTLYKAAPGALAFLTYGFDTLYAPLQGGVLVPDIFSAGGAIQFVGGTSAVGGHSISTTWPAGVPAGLDIVAQYWIADAAAPLGYSASNGITQTTP